jgi:hypothetical protein
MRRTSMYARNIPTAWRMLLTAETNTKKLPVGCGAAEAPGPALDSAANNSLLWGMDVANWTLLLATSPTGGDRGSVMTGAASLFNSISLTCHEQVTNCHEVSLIATPHTETNCEINWNLTCAVLALQLFAKWLSVHVI